MEAEAKAEEKERKDAAKEADKVQKAAAKALEKEAERERKALEKEAERERKEAEKEVEKARKEAEKEVEKARKLAAKEEEKRRKAAEKTAVKGKGRARVVAKATAVEVVDTGSDGEAGASGTQPVRPRPKPRPVVRAQVVQPESSSGVLDDFEAVEDGMLESDDDALGGGRVDRRLVAESDDEWRGTVHDTPRARRQAKVAMAMRPLTPPSSGSLLQEFSNAVKSPPRRYPKRASRK